jgi:hypothetical protein
MARFDLYVDTYSGELVAGPANPALRAVPRLTQGDTVSLRIYLLERTTTHPLGTPYTVASVSALSLKVALGPKNGTAGSALYTQQFTWAKAPDNTYFFADLPLNTTAINTLIGAAESASAWFEIEYTQGGFPTTVLQKEVTINAEVIETGSIVVPSGQTAMTAEEAHALFLTRLVQGAIVLENEASGKQVVLYVDEDGAFHADPIT